MNALYVIMLWKTWVIVLLNVRESRNGGTALVFNLDYQVMVMNNDDGVQEWLIDLAQNSDRNLLARGVLMLWEIWLCRNAKIFAGEGRVAANMEMRVEYFMHQYAETRAPIRGEQGGRVGWSPPTEGTFKINCDGVRRCDGSTGVGVVIRDSGRGFVGALSKPLGNVSSVLEVEAIAIREGVRLAKDLALHKIWVELDAAEVIADISRVQPSLSMHGLIIHDIKQLSLEFDECHFKYIPRTCNQVADRLASLGVSESSSKIWMEDYPNCIADVLIIDS